MDPLSLNRSAGSRPRPVRLLACVAGAVVVATLLAASIAAAPQAVTLRWKFEDGQHLVYRMTSSQETEMPGGSGVMVVESTMTTSWDVIEVNDAGEASVRVTTDRVQMRVQSPMGDMSADSAEDTQAGDPIGRSVTALAGMSYTFVFNESGQVKEVLGLEEAREQMRDAMGQPGNPMTDQLLDQVMSGDGNNPMIGQGVARFPPEPLRPGDSWDASFDFDMPMFGTMTNTSVMTLERIEERAGERIAFIDLDGDMILTADENATGPMAGAMRLGDAAISGNTEWSIDRGLLLGSNTRTMMEMEVTAGGQQMTVVTTSDMRMELVEGE